MRHRNRRLSSLLLALWMLLCALPASAQTTDKQKNALIAEFTQLARQEEIVKLEKQILDLKLQQAQASGDEAALADLLTQLDRNAQTLADLVQQKEDKALAIINAIGALASEKLTELASLQSTLAQTQSQIDAVNASLASLTQEADLYRTYADEALFRGQPVVTAKGFMSTVKVTVALDENGVVTAVKADCSGETAGFGTRCAEDAFLNQFIGRKGPFHEIDVVSGATFTSNAVINAVNSLFPEERTASAKGLLSDVTVYVTLNADGTIATLLVDCSGETRAIATPCTEEAFLSQFIGRKGPFHEIDVVSGATFTSNAVINAVNSLFD